jgi:hypothetical protein
LEFRLQCGGVQGEAEEGTEAVSDGGVHSAEDLLLGLGGGVDR